MKRCTFAAVVVLAVSAAWAGPAQAMKPRYGSHGIQLGFYRYPAPGYAVPYTGASYGYAAPGYAAPSYGFAAPSSSYAPMMAPSGGCSGGGFGVSSYGTASPGYGYSSPGYGYGTPQGGMLFPGFPGGGLVDTIRTLKEVVREIEGLRPTPTADAATKKEIEELRADLKGLRSEVKSITPTDLPRDLDKQLKEIKGLLQTQRADFEELKRALKGKKLID